MLLALRSFFLPSNLTIETKFLCIIHIVEGKAFSSLVSELIKIESVTSLKIAKQKMINCTFYVMTVIELLER